MAYIKSIFIPLFLVLVLSSCWKKRVPNSCYGVACTLEYRMISIAVIDSNGNSFLPQKIETYLDTQCIHVCSSPILFNQNSWEILNDNNKDILGVNQNNTLYIKTYYNNTVLQTDTIIAKADCCHIEKVSGIDTIRIK